MVEFAVFGKWAAVAATGGEGLVFELNDLMRGYAGFGCFNFDLPRTQLWVRANGARFTEFDEYILVAGGFEDFCDAVGDVALGDTVERELQSGEGEVYAVGTVFDMLPTSLRKGRGKRGWIGARGGVGLCFKMSGIGLPEWLNGGVESTVGQLVGLSDGGAEWCPIRRWVFQVAVTVELADFGLRVVEAEDGFQSADFVEAGF